jgi:hypothetical protein
VGYDVTFHPVSLGDLQRYVFDVVDHPELAEARAKEIAKTKRKQKDLIDGFSELPGFVKELRQGEAAFGQTIAFAAAAVVGYIHPFWYARGSALTFLVVGKMVKPAELPIVSLTRVAKGTVAKLTDESGGFLSANYTASGVVPPERLDELSALLDRLSKRKAKPGNAIGKAFDEDGLDSLRRGIAYARARGLGLMEATDLVVPFANEFYTDADNMRAHFLKNVDHVEPGRPRSPRSRS